MQASQAPNPKRLTIISLVTFLLLASLAFLLLQPKPKPPTLEDRIIHVVRNNAYNRYPNAKLVSHDVQDIPGAGATGSVIINVPRSEFLENPSLTGSIEVSGHLGLNPPPPKLPIWEQAYESLFIGPSAFADPEPTGVFFSDPKDLREVCTSVKARRGHEDPRNLVAELDHATKGLSIRNGNKGLAQALLLRTRLLLDQDKTQEAAETLTKAQPAIQKKPELQTEYKTLKSQLP